MNSPRSLSKGTLCDELELRLERSLTVTQKELLLRLSAQGVAKVNADLIRGSSAFSSLHIVNVVAPLFLCASFFSGMDAHFVRMVFAFFFLDTRALLLECAF